MADWPPAAVYAIVASVGLLENFVPPTPSDVVVALGAFLAQRGLTEPTTIFLVTWISNTAGLTAVYLGARHYGPRFVASRVGRLLITPAAIVVVEREYLRFGLAGLVVARLLPGFRSFTAPFAGLIGLSAVRAIVPMAIASGLWYGGIVWLATRIGANWGTLSRAIANLNRSLLVLAVAAVLGILGWVVVTRGRRRYRRTRATLGENLKSFPGLDVRAMEDPVAAAVAGLLLATPLTGPGSIEGGLDTLEAHLRSRWHLGGGQHLALEASPEAVATVVESLEPAARMGVARRLWQLAFSDGAFERHEAHVMERALQILGLPPDEVDRVRRRTGP